MVQWLIDGGAPLEALTFNGWAPLHRACVKGELEVVRYLLDRGADVNRQDTENERTCLHIAYIFAHFEVAKLLIEAGAGVELKNKVGKSAYNIAMCFDDRELTAFLDGVVGGATVEERKASWEANREARQEQIAAAAEADAVKAAAATEKIGGLAQLLHASKLDKQEGIKEAAEAWCEEMGAETVGEIGEAGMIDDFIKGLGLKPIKAKLLRQKLEEAAAAEGA